MTKKHYELIANVLGKKLAEVNQWGANSIEAKCLALAYIEDFIAVLQANSKTFDKIKFLKFINKTYGTNLSY